MNERLRHIFDYSTCLNRRQMRQYVAAQMSSEERHAAEVHLNTCKFCSEALDGLLAGKGIAIKLLEDLNPSFIKEHLELTVPHVHVNSIAAAAPIQKTTAAQHRTIQSNKRIIFLVGGVLSAFAVMWYIEFIKDAGRNKKQVAPATYQSVTVAKPAPAPKKVTPPPVKHTAAAAAVKKDTAIVHSSKKETVAVAAPKPVVKVKKETKPLKAVTTPKKAVVAVIHKPAPAKTAPVITKPAAQVKNIVPAAPAPTIKPPVVQQTTPAAKPAIIGPPPMDTSMR